MNKKFLSAILFGALMVTSTGTFVSCKDYEDDIQNVQEQVDANKSALAALTSQATALQSALDAAKTTAEAAKTAAAEAKKAGDDALAAAKAAEAAAADAKAEAIAEAQKQVDTLKAWVEGQDYVTEEEMSAAIAVVTGRINGIEEALGESLKNLVAADQVALTNIVALQEDLELQKAALEKYQAYVDELYVEIGGEAGLRTQLGQVTNVVTDMQQQLDELWAEIGGEAGLGSTTGTLASAIQALQEELVNLAERDNALEGNINEITQYVSNLIEAQDGNESAIEELWAEINGEGANSIRTQMGQLAGLVGEIQGNLTTVHTLLNNMVTSVSLWAPQSTSIKTLYLYNVVEKDAVFGDKTPIKANENITFTEGKLVSYDDYLTIRVSPTNAVVNKEQISLINSLGEDLNEYLEVVEVKPFDQLLLGYQAPETRNAENKSGLWNVYFKLKENVDPVKFAKEVATKKSGNNNYYVRFAVAVKNAETEGNVISGYNVQVNTPEAISHSELNFYANDQWIWNIKNRYEHADDYTSTMDVEELTWWTDNEEIETPAVDYILKGEDKNVILKKEGSDDNRTWRQFLPVVKGEPISININSYKNDQDEWVVDYNGKIAGFYVTLDKDYAVESTPSEINAWNSYEYENVGTDKQPATLIKGNSGTITIKDLNNVSGDIIGFRVYAVNLDGTLVDPDGRAFYVAIGDVAAETQVVKATIIPETTEDRVAYAELTDAQKEIIRNLYGNSWTWEMDENNPKVIDHRAGYGVEFVKDAEGTEVSKAEDINFVKFNLWDGIEWYLDNGTYKATQTFKNNRGNILGVVEYELTKTLRTAIPEVFAFRTAQETEEGKFIAYMQTESGDYADDTENGIKDLNNIFYGLDDNYAFVFGTSTEPTDDNEEGNVTVEVNENGKYILKVENKYIDNATWHSVAVSYFYRGISTYYDEEKNEWHIGDDEEVPGETYEVKYACWHHASNFAWASAFKAELQWTVEGNTIPFNYSNIVSTNSYNNTYFGLNLDVLVNDKQWLKIKEGSCKLISKEGQENPYFMPEMSGSTITFKQGDIQVEAAPVTDHVENLVFTVIDAFGHEKTISLDVKIKAPEKK